MKKPIIPEVLTDMIHRLSKGIGIEKKGPDIDFSVYGHEMITILPYDHAKAPPIDSDSLHEHWQIRRGRAEPKVLDIGSYEIPNIYTNNNLHLLLLSANSENAKQEVKELTRPLKGYDEGQQVTTNELGNKLIEVINNAGIYSSNYPESARFESASNWVYRHAEGALVGLTGVEGIVALLNSEYVRDFDKWQLVISTFLPGRSGMFKDMYWPGLKKELSEGERDVLVGAIENENLAEFRPYLIMGLAKSQDGRAKEFLEKELEKPDNYHRPEFEHFLQLIQ